MKKELLRILYKYILLLLIAAVLCTGTVFSRYSSSNSASLSQSVERFDYSFTVDAVSSLAFTNANYYLANGIEVAPGKSLRSITFTIDSGESEVSAQSTINFSSSYDFLTNIAFQIVEVNTTTNEETPISQQYVVNDLLNSGTTPITNTSDFKDYDEFTSIGDQALSVSADSANKAFTATAADGAVISLSTTTATKTMTYIYGRGVVIEIINEQNQTEYYNDLSAPNVYIENEESCDFSTLSITLPKLDIEPDSTNATRTFKFYFTTINKINFEEGKYASLTYDSLKDSNTLYYNVLKVVACDENGTATGEKITVKVKIYSNATTEYYYVNGGADYLLSQVGSSNIYGNAEQNIYIDLDSGNFSIDKSYSLTNTETYSMATTESGYTCAMGIIYPMNLNITFAQSSES